VLKLNEEIDILKQENDLLLNTKKQ